MVTGHKNAGHESRVTYYGLQKCRSQITYYRLQIKGCKQQISGHELQFI